MNVKKTNLLVFILCLVTLCCLLGTVSAADVNTDVTDNSTVGATEEITDIQTSTESSEVTADDWSSLKNEVGSGSSDIVKLNDNTEYNGNETITINRNVAIVGTDSSYITGNFSGNIFSSSGNYNVKFINLTFKNINCNIGLQLADSSDTIENCNFVNVATGTGHTSVLYNSGKHMNVLNSNFTNCTTSFGVVTNYAWVMPTMNVSGCVFENNYASTEPGAINNCGNLNVSDSTFIKNRAEWWAGAIHTHSKAHTIIRNSQFVDNVAGWNGGALFTYSTLEVYNSAFIGNNCTTDMGGGAIGAYNYGSIYNLTVVNSTFINNSNTRQTEDNISTANGQGGAISTSEGGYFDVHESTFVNNTAVIGQAICSRNVNNDKNGIPYLQIYNNTFINHTSNTNDTVYIPEGNYTFVNNTFINSPQTIGVNKNYFRINSHKNILKDDDDSGSAYAEILNETLVKGQTVTINIIIHVPEKYVNDCYLVFDIASKNGDYFYAVMDQPVPEPVLINSTDFNYTVKYVCDEVTVYSIQDFVLADAYSTFAVMGTSNIESWNVIENHGVFTVDYDDVADKIVVNLTDAIGNPLPFTDFNYVVDGAETNVTTDENGMVEIDRAVDGKLMLSFNYAGDKNYKSTSTQVQIINHKVPAKVATHLETSNMTQTAVDTSKNETGGFFTATLLDDNGQPLAGKLVQIGFNGKIYNRTTDANGVARLQINLRSAGDYTFAVAYLGDENSTGTFVVNTVRITKKPSRLTLTGNSAARVNAVKTLTVRLTGKSTLNSTYMNAAGKKVTLNVNGKTYTGTTNSNGVATFRVKISRAGTYTITTKFAGDYTYSAKTTTSKITVRR